METANKIIQLVKEAPQIRDIMRFDSLQIAKLPFERKYDSHGPLAIDDRTREIYEDRFRKMPTEPGHGRYNAMKTSMPSIEFYRGEKTACVATIAPTRYMIGEAFRLAVEENRHSQADYEKMSPNMANVSVISFVRYKGKVYLAAQIKGNIENTEEGVLGKGQLHAGFYAENVGDNFLDNNNPLQAAIKERVEKKTGIPYEFLSPSDFIGFVDERITGQVNCATVSKVNDLDDQLQHWDKSIKQGKKMIAGLALVDPEDYSLTDMVGGRRQISPVKWYKAEKEPREMKETPFTIRPYTNAVLNDLDYVVERAGL